MRPAARESDETNTKAAIYSVGQAVLVDVSAMLIPGPIGSQLWLRDTAPKHTL